MTELAQAHQIQKLLAEIKGHEAELSRHAPGTMAYRQAADRVNALRTDLRRAQSGHWCGPHS